MERNLPVDVARPYRTGRAGAVTKMAFGLTAAGAALVSTWGRRRRVGALVGGALVMAGALAERYAVMDAGRATREPPSSRSDSAPVRASRAAPRATDQASKSIRSPCV